MPSTCAIKVAEELGVKYREGLVKNRYIGRTFITPSQRARDYLVNIKLNIVTSVIKDKNVVVVDDSIVRGTTSKRIVTKLREAGAKKIIFMSSCPPIRHACYYGIDMSTEKELIASNKTIEEVREYIGADVLIYTTVEDLKKAVRNLQRISGMVLNGLSNDMVDGLTQMKIIQLIHLLVNQIKGYMNFIIEQ